MSIIRVRLFDQFSLEVGNRVHFKFRTIKVQALLAYLIVENATPVRREALYELLWPGLPQKSAQVNLRQTLYQARKLLRAVADKPIISSQGSIRIDPALDLSSDALEFDRLLAANKTHDHADVRSCRPCRQRLEQAVDLYQGPLLADLYLADSNEFETWAAARRAAYQRRYFDALSTLTTIQLRNGHHAEAEASARRQLQHDNLREVAYQQLMESLARSGQREAALAVYEECRSRLYDELGTAPTKTTTALAGRIAAAELDLTPVQTPEVRGYELLDELGSGAFGIVHRAYQPLIDREVAIKIIKPEHANRPNFIRRFEVEAQTIARLEHPHIVPLYDYWREPDGAFLVMRYMRGGNLAAALQAQADWPLDQVMRFVDQLSEALAAAHAEGIVHRDLKPSNILLDEEGNAYLSDFGIARILSEQSQAADARDIALLTSSPYYTSTEQLQGKPVSPRSDIYTFGFLIFELLSGRKPYADRSLGQVVQKHLTGSLPSIQTFRPGLPPETDDILRRATANDPAARYGDVRELAAQLRLALTASNGHALPPLILKKRIEGNPYKGLRAFQESDADTFFGRDDLVAQLSDALRRSRFVTVIGPSGSGKSSVVKAGLLPRLRAGTVADSAGWFISEMTPGAHPLEELELALLRVAVDPPPDLLQPLQRDARGLARMLKRILPATEDGTPGRLLLVIDQFEELFTLVDDDERRRHFLDNLLTALHEPRSQLCVIVTLRADFYDRPLQIPDLADLIKQYSVVVTPLTRAELEAAIAQPALLAGVALEEGLIARIVDDVRDQPGILPLLQYALTELYERRQDDRMTHDAYTAIGGVTGVLGRRAEAIYADLEPAGQALAKQTFLRLVTLGEGVEDTRRRVRWAEIEEMRITKENLRGDDRRADSAKAVDYIAPVVDRFGAARLLSLDRDPLSRQPTVEVAHEALLREWPRLRGWLTASRDDIRMQRLLAAAAAEWQAAGRDDGYLLRGSRLDQFDAWQQSSELAQTQSEQALLAASLAARAERTAAAERRRRHELQLVHDLAETERQRAEEADLRAAEQTTAAGRLRQRALLLAAALVIAAVLAVAAGLFGRQATTNANLAATREVEAQRNAQIAQSNADLAAAREVEARAQTQRALDNANLAATGEAETARQAEIAQLNAVRAQTNADLATTREAQLATAVAVSDQERSEAQLQARLAVARELAASALASLQEDPERSILLALQSLDRDYTEVGEGVLRQAMQQSRIRLIVPRSLEEAGSEWNVYYSADGTELIEVSGAGDAGFIIYRDATTGRALQTIPCAAACVNGAVSPDERWLAAVADDVDIVIIDLAATRASGAPQLHARLSGHTGNVGAGDWLRFSPDSTRLASASFDKTMKIWDLAQGQLLYSVSAPLQWLFTRPAFSPDGSLLATSGLVRSTEVGTRLIDAATGRTLVTFPREQLWPLFSADGQRLITLTYDGTIHVWDVAQSLRTGVAQQQYSFDSQADGDLRPLAVSPDGQFLADIHRTGQLAIWRLQPDRATLQFELSGKTALAQRTQFSPDSRHLLTMGPDGIGIWDISAGGERELMTLAGHSGTVYYLTLDSSGERLASAGWDKTARVWDAASGVLLQTFTGHSGRLRDVDFSPDGRLLLTSSDDRTARVWDSVTGELLAVLDASDEADIGGIFPGVMSARFSPDGRQIVTAAVDGTVRIWRADSFEEVERFVISPRDIADFTPAWGVTIALFSPDGRYLAAATDGGNSGGGLFRVWEAATGAIVLQHETGPRLFGLDFSPDSSRLAVSATGWPGIEQVQIWDIAAGQPLFSLDLPPITILDVFFSSDGSRLISNSDQGITIWDSENGDRLQNFPGKWSFQLSQDGTQLFIGGEDGLIRAYVTDFEQLVELANSRLTRTLTDAECHQYLHVDSCATSADAGR